jgi:hypothetical protein
VRDSQSGEMFVLGMKQQQEELASNLAKVQISIVSMKDSQSVRLMIVKLGDRWSDL